MGRFFSNLLYPRWRLRQNFSSEVLKAIEAAIGASESRHDGELRFVVEGCLDLPHLLVGANARRRARELFQRMRIWDTRQSCGVLIYVLMAERRVEILADRGIDAKVGEQGWRDICAVMEGAFAAGNFQEGAIAGIAAISDLLATHFPSAGDNPNELPDAPLVL
jgi:uncharacterized membrane protein